MKDIFGNLILKAVRAYDILFALSSQYAASLSNNYNQY